MVQTIGPRVKEGILGPRELASLAVDQRHLRACGLEIEEFLGIDLGESRGIPQTG